ncbi:hypothetical protein GOP47_0009461 [Adiantum capillus-veneris]|uniref:Lipoxygenase n=1 Tax=Adiantum capillus-veneris TaxID=13818 RepID=A0A9D4ZJN8_ADICA|nr:hypothetical protein GOP47_0009461 [Adiantum capillus-veneris]
MEYVDCTIRATVRTLSESYLDLGQDALSELMGNRVSLRLVSLEHDPQTQRPKVSDESNLRFWGALTKGCDSYNTVTFYVKGDFGRPGAILLESLYVNEFYLKSITLEMQDDSLIYFPCHTWICHSELYSNQPRVLFTNEEYLPNETPKALLRLREAALEALQGDGKGQRVYGQRIYDYDLYNDISNPDESEDLRRPILGGSSEYPYPRRCRTGRPHTINDPESEQPELGFDMGYVPRDERFSALKKDLFLGAGIKSFGRHLLSTVDCLIREDHPFESLEQIHRLFSKSMLCIIDSSATTPRGMPACPLEYPIPGVIEVNMDAWLSDREFARQRLAGKNPVLIQLLTEFPPQSKLDPNIYGNPKSSITLEDIQPFLEGLSLEEVIAQRRLYILDHHDVLMPFIHKINESSEGKMYASRTIFFLTEERVLLPIAIELTLPPKEKGQEANKRVFTPGPTHSEWLWRLARTHVAITDAGYHQLVTHWLRTHACIEPIIVATRRQLSIIHPLHVLLLPHFKDTLHINAMAKTSLINAGGKIESHYSAGRYCMEISSVAYKSWRLDEEALPRDLLKRGMAVKDPSAKHGLRLTIEDYPYAVDGLDVWAAIRQWVQDYLALYYIDDKALQEDTEVQRWWTEIRDVGHGDHAGAKWWVPMHKVEELVEVVTTLIWLMSAYHAAVNFGQYAYGAFMPNSPCMARRLIPEKETPEYFELLFEPEKFFLSMVPTQGATTRAMAVLEILAQHLDEEEYLGERVDRQWTSNRRALAALETFRQNLADAETAIEARNAEARNPHRHGPASLPYTLLMSTSPTSGLTFRGVPNSISM